MDLVIVQNRKAVTSSLQVAENFEKEHRNVLRDIEGLLKSEQTQNYFYKSSYVHEQNNQEYPMYYMNRDGFTLLAMGFNGKKALEFKLKYIEAFNQMEQQLSKPNLPTSYKEAVQHLLLQIEENEKLQTTNLVLEQQVNELQPKASYYDMVLQNKSLLSVSKIAKDYGFSAIKFNQLLNKLGVQYKQGDIWLLYAKYQDKGYTQTSTHIINADHSKISTKWTQKGRLFIYEILKNNGLLPLIERENVS